MESPAQTTITIILSAVSHLSLPLGFGCLDSPCTSFWCSCLALNPRDVWKEVFNEKIRSNSFPTSLLLGFLSHLCLSYTEVLAVPGHVPHWFKTWPDLLTLSPGFTHYPPYCQVSWWTRAADWHGLSCSVLWTIAEILAMPALFSL